VPEPCQERGSCYQFYNKGFSTRLTKHQPTLCIWAHQGVFSISNDKSIFKQKNVWTDISYWKIGKL